MKKPDSATKLADRAARENMTTEQIAILFRNYGANLLRKERKRCAAAVMESSGPGVLGPYERKYMCEAIAAKITKRKERGE